MVSSKCLSVVSPSPLRFLAALIPPWAQTEWERLTGTMEKRSTLPPASAILMTAASPAKPPPTTMILGAAIRFRALSTCLERLQEKTFARPARAHARVESCDAESVDHIGTGRRCGSMY